MRCLWITRQDPRPADSGDLIYSLGLLRSLASAGGIGLTVLAHRGKPADRDVPGVRWELPGTLPRKNPISLASPLPSDAHRLGNRTMRQALVALLARQRFDAVVIDQAACGWALDLLPDSLPLLYLAHNHEAAVRTEIAASHEGSLPLRIALRRDASQYARLERAVCSRADVISAITPRDEKAFRDDFPETQTLVLSPGFPSELIEPQRIDAHTSRRVILAGTFEWIAKRRNLEAFLKAADEVFPGAGIGFQVVGKADPGYFASLSARYPWARFEANVPSMSPYLRDVRIGLIPEALGGGFKLKALDYIFRGIPLAAISPALSGLPLEPGTEAIAEGDLPALARSVATRIDDLEFLNLASDRALGRCRDAFHWEDRGRRLATCLHQLGSAPRKPRSA